MANAFSQGLRVAGNRLNPKRPVLNPQPKPIQPIAPPLQSTQPVVPQPMPQVAPLAQPTVQPVAPQQGIPQQGATSPMQEVLRRKRMLEI